MSRCYACGEPIRRGYPMVTNKGENVIICERCKRLWKKSKAEWETPPKFEHKGVVTTCVSVPAFAVAVEDENSSEKPNNCEPQIVDWGKRKPCTLELFDDDGNYIEPKDEPQTGREGE